MAEDKDETKTTPLTPEELKMMYSLPSIFANRILVNWRTEVRLTFGEQDNEGITRPRCSVTMGIHQAIEMHELLSRLISNWVQQAQVATPPSLPQ